MTRHPWDLFLIAAAAVVVGVAAPFLPLIAVFALIFGLGVWLASNLFRFGNPGLFSWHPVLLVVAGIATLTIDWNGLRPGGVAIPDLFLSAALILVVALWLQNRLDVPLPAWLAAAAVGFLASELIAELFVPNPPADPPPSFTPPGSPLATIAKLELAVLVVPMVIGAVASSWRRLDLFASLWVLSACVSAGIAVVDFVTGAKIGASLVPVTVAERQAGLAIHPNHLALTCAMAIPIALIRAAGLQGRGRMAAIVATSVLGAGVLVSGSRVGLLAAFTAVVLTGLLVSRLRKRIVAAGLASIIVIVAIGAFVPQGQSLFFGFDRLAGTADAANSNEQRGQQLKESFDISLDHPITGVGYGKIIDAHTLPLQYWESGGVVAVFSFLLYTVGSVGSGWRLLQIRGLPEGSTALAGALTASILVWLLAGLGQSPVVDRFIYVPVGLLLGMRLAILESRKRVEAVPIEPPPVAVLPSGPPVPGERIPVAG
jgi:hypothetical protein